MAHPVENFWVVLGMAEAEGKSWNFILITLPLSHDYEGIL